MALPTYVGASTPQGSAGDITVSPPAGIQSGDDLWLVIEANSNQPPSTPSGWSPVRTPFYGETAGAGSTLVAVFHKKAGSSEGNVTITDVGNHLLGFMAATRGGHATTPVDDEDGGSEENTDTSLSIPGLTTNGADRLVLLIAATALDSDTPAWSDWTNSDLANLTERVEAGTSAGGGGGLVLVTGEKATQGTFGATTATAPADHKAFMVIAIAPAAGGGGTAHEVDVNDSVAVSDATTVSRGIRLTVDDSAGLSDQLSSEADFFRALADSLGLTDTLTREAAFFRTLADSVALSDAISAGLFFARSVNDSVALLDALTRALGIHRTVADSVALSDSVSPQLTPGGPQNFTVNINDSVVIFDALHVAFFDSELEARMQRLWRHTRRRDARRSFGG